jgi:hypothetical protein
MSFEDVSPSFQLMFEVDEVVDLAVENDSGGAIFTGHGLVSAGDVDDREPAHAQRYAILYQHPLIIGTTMLNDPAHAIEYLCARCSLASFAGAPEINESSYATHCLLIAFKVITQSSTGMNTQIFLNDESGARNPWNISL